MKIITRGMEVRVFPEDQEESDALDLVCFRLRRGLHIRTNLKYLFFLMPCDKDALYEALRIIVGRRQADRLSEAVRNEVH